MTLQWLTFNQEPVAQEAPPAATSAASDSAWRTTVQMAGSFAFAKETAAARPRLHLLTPGGNGMDAGSQLERPGGPGDSL